MPDRNTELPKIAVRLVAVDRQVASATRGAIRSWARRQKATPRTVHAMQFADALEEALSGTTVSRRPRKRATARRRTRTSPATS